MPGGKHGYRTYDDDDFDDYEDDYEDYDPEEEGHEESFHWDERARLGQRDGAGAPERTTTGKTNSDDLLAELIPGFSTLNKGLEQSQRQAAVDGKSQTLTGASGSALAQFISGPPPLRPSGKPQKAGYQNLAQRAAEQAAREPPAESSGLRPFKFDRPSPDDIVARAQTHSNAGPSASADKSWLSELIASSPADSPTSRRFASDRMGDPKNEVTVLQQGKLNADQARVDEDGWQKIPLQVEMEMLQQAAQGADGILGLQADDAPRERKVTSIQKPAETPEEAPPVIVRRPLSEYRMEADLERRCAEAAKAEEAENGGRTKLHLVVLGHVDAGKSTLMGRLLHELGVVSQKVVHKHQKEAAQMGKASFAWAWLLDERPQERARGVTIDVASAHFETPKHAVTLLDAPGHRDFVPNMIAGAAQADAALLLVDGSKGSFEAGFESAAGFGSLGGGQTREHAQLARSLGVDQMAVVISKLDTCDYSQARFEEIKAVMTPFLKTCGFKESSLQWLPAVGTQNENLTKPPTAPGLAAWWRGPSLVEAIDIFRSADRRTDLPLRLPINDVFKGERGGQSVGGKLEAGAIKVGTSVKIMPSGEEGTIKSIQMGGKAKDLARAGDSADVTLANIDAGVLGSGAVICHPEFPVALVTRVEARVVVLDVAMPIVQGQQVMIHAHAASETGHISRLIATVDAKKGERTKKRPRVLTKGQSAIVEVTASRPTCLEPYADCRALGRVVLRESGQTLAVGIVTEILE